MPVGDSELLNMFEHVLRLSRVDKTQTVAVLKTSYSNPKLAWAAMEAAQRLGAKVYGVELPALNHASAMGNDLTGYIGNTALSGNKGAQIALSGADLIVDTMLLLHSPEQGELLAAGKRMLLVCEPPEILARMLPTEEDKRRVMAGEKRLKAAKKMEVYSKAGTEFVCSLGQYPAVTEYGFADEPGRWDHWPSGFLFSWPNEKTAQGKIVIDVGDIIYPFKSYAQSRITLDVKDGFITKISGGFDAEFLESYMNTFNDPDVFAISHIGWGLQPRAHWTRAWSLRQARDGRDRWSRVLRRLPVLDRTEHRSRRSAQHALPHGHPAAALHPVAGRRSDGEGRHGRAGGSGGAELQDSGRVTEGTRGEPMKPDDFEALEANYGTTGFNNRLGFGTKPALILIDLVEAYFRVGSPLYHPRFHAALESSIRLKEAANKASIPVILTNVQIEEGRNRWRRVLQEKPHPLAVL